jgi:predicted GH43/DUF377 family glycosyl hydrolase
MRVVSLLLGCLCGCGCGLPSPLAEAFVVPRAAATTMAASGNCQQQQGLVFPTASSSVIPLSSVGGPVVHRYIHDEAESERWVMWYHGRETEFEDGVVNAQGSGRIYKAESQDGMHWEEVPGQMSRGSVLDVNEEQWWSFDTSHCGLGDVTVGASDRIHSKDTVGTYFMHFFGGNYEEADEGVKGSKLRIGVAISQDGINWSRVEGEHADGSVIACGQPGEFDESLVSHPNVITYKGSEFRMYYTGGSGPPGEELYTMGLAVSQDGLKWKKRGPVFSGGAEGEWDCRGVLARSMVTSPMTGEISMLYEGVSASGERAIGLATSPDGISWKRHGGGPVFCRSNVEGAWDSGGVGSPRLVELFEKDGEFILYYGGWETEGEHRIGMAKSQGASLTSWARI